MAFDRRSQEAARIRTGLGLIVVLAVLALAVFFLDAAVRATAEGERITVLADAAPGLGPGSAVWVAGRPVGRVLSVEFRPPGTDGDHLAIHAALDRTVGPALRADAGVEVRASDLLAPVVVAIDPGTGSSPPWNYADTLRLVGPRLDQEALLAMADTLRAATLQLRSQVAATRTVLQTGSGSIQRFRSEPEVIAEVRRELDRLSDAMLEDFPGSSLARLAADTVVGPTAERLGARLESWNQAPERGSARRALETATVALDRVGMRLGEMVDRLERGEGTAGRALVDTELQRQLEALRGAIADLSGDLARDPSRWLRVRIF